ncbi:MAG: helix-turn-helix domain-containing protein [Deltaproteobacteria bacterium]|nr:helix-turn-helix domain-containing protein [Deltaproteobacteria bacterium]
MTLKIPEKKELIRELYAQGAFKAPKSPEYVAGVLGLGRATVFKYLKKIKGQTS